MKLDKTRLEIVKEEWGHCESGIERYDNLVFQIRGWATSAVAALIAAAFTLNEPAVAAVGIVTSIFFWGIEAINKSYQSVFIERSHEIQQMLTAHMNDELTEHQRDSAMFGVKFQKLWEDGKGDDIRSILTTARFRNVMSVYLSLILVGCACLGVLLFRQLG